MKNIKNILFGILVFHFSHYFSQQGSSNTFETGYLINKPLKTEDHLVYNGYTYGSDISYKYYTTVGNYVKYGKERNLFDGAKWTVFFPYGVSYLKQNYRYYLNGYYSGCFNSGYYDKMVETYNQYLGVYGGLGFTYQEGKLLFSTSSTLSKAYLLSNHNTSFAVTARPYLTGPLYLSSQLSVMFKISKRLLLGPSCDIYYFTFSSLGQMFDKTNGLTRAAQTFGVYSSGLPVKSLWINPAFKMQFGF